MQYPNSNPHMNLALPICDKDIQQVQALCNIAGCSFQRRPDEGGYLRFWVWHGDNFLNRQNVYGLCLETWQLIVKGLING